MTFACVNETNGQYPDDQVWWSTTIGGVTTTNTIAAQPYFEMPANSSGRMEFYLGPQGSSSPYAKPGDLIACEGLHAGQLFLGGDLMLLNNGDGTLDTEGRMRIQTGLYPDGSGLKHQTVSTGAIASGAAVKVPLTWATPFNDENYQAICTVGDNSGFLQVINTALPTQGQVIALVKNNDVSSSHSGLVACFAMHN